MKFKVEDWKLAPIDPEKLREVRVSAGYTQEEVAAYFNISRVSYSRWENGTTTVPRPQRPAVNEFILSKGQIFNTPFVEQPNGYYKITVPFIPIKYQPDFIEYDIKKELTLDFLFEEVHHSLFVAIEVESSNMDNGTVNSLKKGDIALIQYIKKEKFETEYTNNSNNIYVVIYEGTLFCVGIEKFDKRTNEIHCFSYNKDSMYKNFAVCLDEIKNIFKVVQRVTTIS